MTDWLVLFHHLPPKPDYLRVKLRRRLSRLHAVPLRNSVYVLPHRPETLEDLQWLSGEIRAEGGDAIVCQAQFIDGVMTRKATIKSLTLSDHTIAIVGADAIARHTWTSEGEADGKPTSTKIGVLQVWQKQGGTWKLLARQAFRTPPAT